MTIFDVAIIGGGINGCGCAADAALRGLSVFLCDKGNIAGATSSNSSKLIHGGLRYLEYYDFALVKKALDERQRLLTLAPHLVHPEAIVIPLLHEERPAWLVRAGLFVYDHLSFTNRLPNSQHVYRHSNSDLFTPLQEKLNEGFQFYDCGTDDARLTITNALQAEAHGAVIEPYTALINAEVVNNLWHLTLLTHDQQIKHIQAKTVINAGGPWLEHIASLLHTPLTHHITLIKGSHIVVPRLYQGDFGYLLQHHDKRIVFVLPFHGYTMIGTTDVTFDGNLDNIQIDADEIAYLLELVNTYFAIPLQESDIVHTWSGVRPLIAATDKNPSALSRDYTIDVSTHPAPNVAIFGGKITTYRQLAVQAIDKLKLFFPHLPASSTATTLLPGASLEGMDLAQYKTYAIKTYFWLEEATLQRYLASYGTRTELLLQGCHTLADLGFAFAPTLYEQEIDYLCQNEWARTVDEILWRHTKLGLHIDEAGRKKLAEYLMQKYLFTTF